LVAILLIFYIPPDLFLPAANHARCQNKKNFTIRQNVLSHLFVLQRHSGQVTNPAAAMHIKISSLFKRQLYFIAVKWTKMILPIITLI